ncbi:aspartate dehydrogenase [Phaeobacter sp. NW0010-22]|uniref:aspartate dehydrogenase n=1 Tax=Phaeobacter sp. NW0010-22 TaxID=3135907 RepID=UPI00310AE6F9
MKIGLIGNGSISRYAQHHLMSSGHQIDTILVRPDRVSHAPNDGPTLISDPVQFPDDLDLIADCAGHQALAHYGPDILRAGYTLVTVSIGALADQELHKTLQQAATKGNGTLVLATGAIGALDTLRSAQVGTLKSVRYIGRKPPQGWRGSAAESKLDLSDLKDGAKTHFQGSARQAALEYPKNANVAAAVALAGVGFDATEVELIADATVDRNIHEIHAHGDFGSFNFRIEGQALPDNPRSSALAAMSVVSTIQQHALAIRF